MYGGGQLKRVQDLVARMRGRSRGKRRRAARPEGTRSVVFLNNSYYHFYYLARALRARGWDAISVSIEDPNGLNAGFYHGEDLNLFHPDPFHFRRRTDEFFHEALESFDLLHFSGDGCMSFFPENYSSDEPPDIVRWKTEGRKLAYSIGGCNDGVSRDEVAEWSALDGSVVCDRCIWNDRPDVCRPEKSHRWAKMLERFCDLICTEGSPALGAMASSKAFREPLSMCLDPDFWRPDLAIPAEHRLERAPGELLVYHAVGNFQARSDARRNIKGTGAVIQAVDRLRAEGMNVRLVFVTGKKSTEVRYYQAQADVVIDQLNYGRFGSNARESLMLGRPTICYLNRHELEGRAQLKSIAESPLVSAGEQDVYEVLRLLLLDEGRRRRLAEESRAYALRWHSSVACAERYEQVYDDLMARGEHRSFDLTPQPASKHPRG